MSGLAVEISRWFICKHQARIGYQSPGNRHALTLAPRELVRPVTQPL
jgi:hypothetical protein